MSRKVSTLRSKRFSIVLIGGPITLVTHDQPFTVDHMTSKPRAGRHQFRMRGWPVDGTLRRDVSL